MRALGAEVVIVEQAPNGIPGQVSGEGKCDKIYGTSSDLKLVELETDKIVKVRFSSSTQLPGKKCIQSGPICK